MEILLHQRKHLLTVVADVGTQSPVLIVAQLLDDAVNHCRLEHIVLLEYSSLCFKAVC